MIVPWLAAAWRQTTQRIAAGRVPHALLIAGPAGLGKRAFAQALVETLLCEARKPDGHACGSCRGCTLLHAGSHPDFVRVGIAEDASEIKIDQLRQLCQRLSMTSQFGGLQVALLEPAEAMNVQAANALLKTLEEPAANTVIVLVADHAARLPATIRSRCQTLAARFPPRADALAWLAAHAVGDAEAPLLLDLAAGNPGLALSYARPEQEALRRSVLADLEALATRRGQPTEMAARWVKDQPDARLALAVDSVRLAAWRARGALPGDAARGSGGGEARGVPSSFRGAAGAGGARPDELARLTTRTDFFKLAQWWDRANVARDQLRTPLRADLLLLEVLRDFRDLAA